MRDERALFIVMTILDLMILGGCNESKFDSSSSSTKAAVQKEEASADSVAVAPVTQAFSLEAEKQPIDLVWVVDNSASMIEENPIAQANLDAFAKNVTKTADLRMALISFKEGATAVNLSESLKAAHHIQIDANVGSTNLLAILASATCAADSTEAYKANPGSYAGTMKLCGQIVKSKNEEAFLEDEITVEAVKGKLAKFYRPAAKKVFVFVTDDNADFVTSANFLALVEPSLGKEGGKPVVFSFQGVEGATCSISAVGGSYTDLARATLGETFDICAEDWSQHFSRLTKAVSRVTAKSFKLDGAAKEVLSVAVDGQKLKRDAFKLQKDGSVKVAESVFAKAPKNIEIVYLPN